MNTASLKDLGFSEKECEIYILLLQHGKMGPAEISKLTQISRPTVYSVAKELVKKGVILEDLGGPSRTFIPKPPEDLSLLINREQKRLDAKKYAVSKAILELKGLAQATKYTIPKIIFIPEEDVERYLYKQTPTWNASIRKTKTIYWGFQDPSLVAHYEAWIDWYWQQSNPPKLQLLSNVSNIETEMKAKNYINREIRFWQNTSAFTTTTWVMGDYVVMINTKNKPFHLVEFHDATLAENFRQLFSGIWKTLI
jgi:DNA-binding MarR family transcriptional regulator